MLIAQSATRVESSKWLHLSLPGLGRANGGQINTARANLEPVVARAALARSRSELARSVARGETFVVEWRGEQVQRRSGVRRGEMQHSG